MAFVGVCEHAWHCNLNSVNVVMQIDTSLGPVCAIFSTYTFFVIFVILLSHADVVFLGGFKHSCEPASVRGVHI